MLCLTIPVFVTANLAVCTNVKTPSWAAVTSLPGFSSVMTPPSLLPLVSWQRYKWTWYGTFHGNVNTMCSLYKFECISCLRENLLPRFYPDNWAVHEESIFSWLLPQFLNLTIDWTWQLYYVHQSSTLTTSVAHTFCFCFIWSKKCGADSHTESHKKQFRSLSVYTNHTDNISWPFHRLPW